MGSREDRIQLLGKTPVFSGLSKMERRQLAPVFKPRLLDTGEVLCRQGDIEDYLVVVARGELIIEVDDEDGETTVVSRRGLAETVGEMACLDPSPRSATVRAAHPTQVLVLTRTMLDSLKVNASGLFSRVVRSIAHRLAGMLDETNELISGLLETKRAPTQPRQPSLRQVQASSSGGRRLRERVKLSSEGVLKGLTETEREVLRTVSEAREYEAGEVICIEGESAPEAYFLVDGGVDVLKNIGGVNYRLASMSTGAFLGQRALLREGKRSATLRASLKGATIVALARVQFEALLQAESTLAIGFQEAVTIAGIRQLRQANDMAAYLGARELKRDLPGPRSPWLREKSKKSNSVRGRVQELVDIDLEEADDIESLASAYLQTAMADWDLTPSELDKIEVVKGDGEMSAAEKKMRALKKKK